MSQAFEFILLDINFFQKGFRKNRRAIFLTIEPQNKSRTGIFKLVRLPLQPSVNFDRSISRRHRDINWTINLHDSPSIQSVPRNCIYPWRCSAIGRRCMQFRQSGSRGRTKGRVYTYIFLYFRDSNAVERNVSRNYSSAQRSCHSSLRIARTYKYRWRRAGYYSNHETT